MIQSLKALKAEASRRGLAFDHYPDAYSYDVISCSEAASARNVDLGMELKHLLLDIRGGYYVAHVMGNARLSLRKVKRYLVVKQARLANLHHWRQTRLERGTVCPFQEPLWSLPHLVDHEVLHARLMTTNDGTMRGFIKFDPHLLCLATDYTIGDFAERHVES